MVDGGGETPGPIPNPEAKPFSADGTALVTVWESRTPPDMNFRDKGRLPIRKAALVALWAQWCSLVGQDGDDERQR